MYAIILFRSLTYAQRGSRALSLAGIPSYVMKAPQGLTEKGCGYGVRLNEAKLRRAVALLDERGIIAPEAAGSSARRGARHAELREPRPR